MISERSAEMIRACLKDFPANEPVGVYMLRYTDNLQKWAADRRLLVVHGASDDTRDLIWALIQPDFNIEAEKVFPNVETISGRGGIKPFENWRGRVLRASEITTETDPTKLLRSWWRLVVTRRALLNQSAEYFVRHDISPTFYSPGYSVAGGQEWKDAVRSNLRNIFGKYVPAYDHLALNIGTTHQVTDKTKYEKFGDIVLPAVIPNNFIDRVVADFERKLASAPISFS